MHYAGLNVFVIGWYRDFTEADVLQFIPVLRNRHVSVEEEGAGGKKGHLQAEVANSSLWRINVNCSHRYCSVVDWHRTKFLLIRLLLCPTPLPPQIDLPIAKFSFVSQRHAVLTNQFFIRDRNYSDVTILCFFCVKMREPSRSSQSSVV